MSENNEADEPKNTNGEPKNTNGEPKNTNGEPKKTSGGSGGSGKEEVFKELNQDEVEDKVDIYKSLLKNLLKKCRVAKKRLDMFHCTLYKINSFIQLTVIYFSATSTFLQALFPDSSNPTLDSNTTDIVIDEETIEDILEKQYNINVIDTSILFITSYSSLIIALARHFKIEERVGSISNLIERFAEILSRIQYDLELLKPWEDEKYYSEDSDKKGKKKEWMTLEENIKKEYNHLLDIKKELFNSYEKMIGESIYRYYRRIFETFNSNYVDYDSDDEPATGRNYESNANFCWCKKPRCMCCSFGCSGDPGYDIEEGRLRDEEIRRAEKKIKVEEKKKKNYDRKEQRMMKNIRRQVKNNKLESKKGLQRVEEHQKILDELKEKKKELGSVQRKNKKVDQMIKAIKIEVEELSEIKEYEDIVKSVETFKPVGVFKSTKTFKVVPKKETVEGDDQKEKGADDDQKEKGADDEGGVVEEVKEVVVEEEGGEDEEEEEVIVEDEQGNPENNQ